MLTTHLIDSLSITPFIHYEHIIDLGTGGGLPGISLAILTPKKRYVLVDNTKKKVNFLKYIKNKLKLHNVLPIQKNIKKYESKLHFHHAVTRACFSKTHYSQWYLRYLEKNNRLLSMIVKKNKAIQLEIVQNNSKYVKLYMPISYTERYLIIIDNSVC